MKKSLPLGLKKLLYSFALLLLCTNSAWASHIVGADLYYKWVSGLTYQITVVLYGDCGPASSSAFSSLPTSVPQVCIFDGPTSVATVNLNIVAPNLGVEITPVCPDSLNYTQCTNTSYVIPGIKKFVYTGTYTLPHRSHTWRFLYLGNNGGGTNSGRAAAITNIVSGTTIQLTDSLDNYYHDNTNAQLTNAPTPFFPNLAADSYNPGAIDPDNDSLMFFLTDAQKAGGGCNSAGLCTYVGTAWPGQPITAQYPLQCTAGMWSFNNFTGQINFKPNAIQRSVVVYNIREYRNDTFVGTCQREMTFLTRTSSAPPPDPGYPAAVTAIVDDSFDVHICQNSGPFTVALTPTITDPTKHITVSYTGPTGSGITFTVLNNGTNTPTVNIAGNSSTVAAGNYIFFVKLQDDNCPISGQTLVAYTISILPAPNIAYTLNYAATCLNKASIHISPTGDGKPWTIKMSDPSLTPPTDTFMTWVDSVGFDYLVAPGNYFLSIFSSVSNLCGKTIPVSLFVPSISPAVSGVNPTYCGANDGKLVVTDLPAGSVDSVRYDLLGATQPTVTEIADPAGVATVPGFGAGMVSNIIVSYGYCVSQPLGPVTFVNPPFTWSYLTSSNPTRCGFDDGIIKIHGLHPGQSDSLFYTANGTATSGLYYINADSLIVLSGLAPGSYLNFYAHTANGACATPPLTGASLVGPTITANFDTIGVTYGCHGDAVSFMNQSTHVPADSIMTYTWQYGDGTTATESNPVHVFTNSATDTTFKIIMIMTNSKCVSEDSMTITLRNYIQSSFSLAPNNYLCQSSPLTITNNSTGGNPNLNVPLQYTWVYGDGTTSTTSAPTSTHIFTNSGTYNVMLVAGNMIPCYDTSYQTIAIDSISGISISATDSVICRGQGITFSSNYSSIGNNRNDSSVVWTFDDGTQFINRNPVMHMYDHDGDYTVTVSAIYRACPDTSITKKIHVIKYAEVDLGSDTSICPGSTPIMLSDKHNTGTPGATWHWSTGETTSSIMVGSPGQYTATITIAGCSSSDTIFVANDCYMSMPNVFTPNGDGLNDYFFPRQILTRGVVTFNMTIYNRWGQEIFQSDAPDGRGWDGAMNNQPQPEGVYVYIIDVTFKDGQREHHQGNVTLLR